MSSKHSDWSYSKVNEMGKSPKPFKLVKPFSISDVIPLTKLSINSVVLHKWWLGKAQPRGLSVVGFERRGQGQERLFHSSAIAKRYDTTTLETTDGITITISNLINTSLTLENGFPPQICSDFLFGFPYDWEEYASLSSNQEYVSTAACNAVASLDDLPATRVRDLQIFSAGDPIMKRNIFDFAFKKLTTHASENLTISDSGNKHPSVKKVTVFQNDMDDNNISCSSSRSKRVLESQKEVPSRGVTTRSMTRFKRLMEKQANEIQYPKYPERKI